MELEGSITGKNLQNLLLGELQANFRYNRMAKVAREEGYQYIADILSATAKNEMEHAISCFNFLNDIKDIKSSLAKAIQRENDESTKIYPDAAKVAEEEGFTEIACFLRGMSENENSHWEHLIGAMDTLEAGREIEGRTVGYSETYIAQAMQPSQASPSGKVHGGELMKLMDSASGLCAGRHCRQLIVTKRADNMRFLVPVEVGDLVITHSRLVFTGRTSMTVRVDVHIDRILIGERRHAIIANFYMVSMDSEGKPLPVPPLVVTTEEEKALYEEAKAEYEARKNKSA